MKHKIKQSIKRYFLSYQYRGNSLAKDIMSFDDYVKKHNVKRWAVAVGLIFLPIFIIFALIWGPIILFTKWLNS